MNVLGGPRALEKQGRKIRYQNSPSKFAEKFAGDFTSWRLRFSIRVVKIWESPNVVVSNLVVCNFYTEALFCAPLRPFVLFCGLPFALICALLRAVACFCVRPRLERPRLGTAEKWKGRNLGHSDFEVLTNQSSELNFPWFSGKPAVAQVLQSLIRRWFWEMVVLSPAENRGFWRKRRQ